VVPFARNTDGDLLVVSAKGVSSWSGDDGLGSPDAPSLSVYLEVSELAHPSELNHCLPQPLEVSYSLREASYSLVMHRL